MKSKWLGVLFTLLSIAPAAQAKSIMLEFSYRLQANRNYETGLYRVYDAPVNTRKVMIQTRGEYCNLVISGVDYTRWNGDYLQRAYSLGGAYWEIPYGQVRALNVHFRQDYWTNVDCDLKIYAVD